MFKVNDRVKIIKSPSTFDKYDHLVGEYGIIYNIYRYGNNCDIIYDNSKLNDYEEEDGTYTGHYKIGMECLKHCRLKNTKIARKMHKNHKVIDENWIEV